MAIYKHYLVVVDRLSNWIDITATPAGSAAAGARGLIKCLRSYFGGKGVLRVISSDGDTEFTAAPTKAFLRRWGVEHCVSSAYRAVLKKCPGERHIVEPRGFFYLKEQIF